MTLEHFGLLLLGHAADSITVSSPNKFHLLSVIHAFPVPTLHSAAVTPLYPTSSFLHPLEPIEAAQAGAFV